MANITCSRPFILWVQSDVFRPTKSCLLTGEKHSVSLTKSMLTITVAAVQVLESSPKTRHAALHCDICFEGDCNTMTSNFGMHQPCFARHLKASVTRPGYASWEEQTVWSLSARQATCTIGAFGSGVSTGPDYVSTAVDLPRAICKRIPVWCTSISRTSLQDRVPIRVPEIWMTYHCNSFCSALHMAESSRHEPSAVS